MIKCTLIKFHKHKIEKLKLKQKSVDKLQAYYLDDLINAHLSFISDLKELEY